MKVRSLPLFVALLFVFVVTSASFAATGYEYTPDADTAGLWHFAADGDMADASDNQVETGVEGNAAWDANEAWNLVPTGSSFRFDGQTLVVIPSTEKAVQPTDAITVEAWVYPEDLGGWKLFCAHWGGAVVGSFHFGAEAAIPKFHINTDQGVGFAAAAEALVLDEWQHVAGSFDGTTIRIYVNGVEAGTAEHAGQLVSGDPDFEVIIGSKASREFQWVGLIDEVRISSVARSAGELSPNLAGPTTAVQPDANLLSTVWGQLKEVR